MTRDEDRDGRHERTATGQALPAAEPASVTRAPARAPDRRRGRRDRRTAGTAAGPPRPKVSRTHCDARSRSVLPDAALWVQLTEGPCGSRPPARMRQHGGVTSAPQPIFSPLVTAALETERHVASGGWDQPPRLFALVRTAGLVEQEPQLRAQLDHRRPGRPHRDRAGGPARTSSLESLLGRLAWPADVDGVALAVERIVVPPEAEQGLPEHPEEAAEALRGAPGPQGRAAAGGGAARRRVHLPAAPA